MPYIFNVPSNLIEFEDGGLSFRNDVITDTTRSVLLLGMSQDGPLEPVAIDIDTVAEVFGRDVDENGMPNGGTITTYVNDLYRAGCRDIRAMKICGATAKADISNAPRDVVQTSKIEETLGIVDGNDSTTLTLNNSRVKSETISIYINDKMLPSSFQFDAATSVITIPAGVADAGAPVMVKYNYIKSNPNTPINESLSVVANGAELQVTVKSTPDADSVKIKINGAPLAADRFTIAGNIITFTNPAAPVKKSTKSKVYDNKDKTVHHIKEDELSSNDNQVWTQAPSDVIIGEGTIVVVDYTSTVDTEEAATDTSHNNVRYMTATSLQTLVLAETPKEGTFHLYCNDAEIGSSLYAITQETVQGAMKPVIKIKKEKLSRNRALTCSYLVEKIVSEVATINLESFFAGAMYNTGSVEVVDLKNKDEVVIGKTVLIHKPESKKVPGEEPLTYSSLQFPTFDELVNAINSDLHNGVYKASTDFGGELTSNLVLVAAQFNGGDSGINATNDEIRESLSGKRDDNGYLLKEGIYQLLEGYNVDYVVLTGIYADDELSGRETFDYDLAMFCAAMSHKTKITYGVMAMKPCKSTSLQGIKDHVDRLSNFNKDGRRFLVKKDGKVYTNNKGKSIDLGQYIRVVAGPEPMYLNDDMGKHPTNPAVAYVGLQSALRPQSSPMNKPLHSSKGLRYRLAEPYLQALTKANLVTFLTKTDRNGVQRQEAYVYDSMTCAGPYSDYVRTTVCEVSKLIGDDVREIADPYIGEPPTVESRNSFAAALSKRFSERRAEGAVADTVFEIIETPQDMLMGDCKVKLTITVPGERRRIMTTIGLKPPINK